jgi:von Willebrand factor type A domain
VYARPPFSHFTSTELIEPLDRPSRWEAQADAVNMIFTAKTNANPESSVGLMSMGGKGPEVLVTLTTDFGKLLDGMHRTKIRGRTHLATGIQIAGVCGSPRLKAHELIKF